MYKPIAYCDLCQKSSKEMYTLGYVSTITICSICYDKIEDFICVPVQGW